MLNRDDLNRKYQEVTIMNRAESEKALVLIDYRRKVGEIILDIGQFLALGEAPDFRILLIYEGKERILDQDEVLFDLIAKYKFPVVEK